MIINLSQQCNYYLLINLNLINISIHLFIIQSITYRMQNKVLLKYKNPVLVKDQDGKVKPTTYDLPNDNHTYGKKVIDDPQPIKYVVNNWDAGQLSRAPASNQKDFKQLNRRAISNNIHTAKDQYGFRSTMDIKVPIKEGKRVMPIRLPQEDFTYGVENRPSTPVKLVIGNCYAIDASNKNETMYQTQTMAKISSENKKLHPFKTKSQALRQQKVKKEKQYRQKANVDQLFKMSKFEQTKAPRIDSNIRNLSTTSIKKTLNQQQKHKE